MSAHTSWKIGGQAERFYLPESREELQQLLVELEQRQQSFYLIGGGSNLLVSDCGLKGAVICLRSGLQQLSIKDDIIIAEAGVPLPALAQKAAAAGLSGLEFAAGIPGTVGGAIVMNAGAHGGQMADLVQRVLCYDRQGRAVQLDREQCQFAYRQSCFKQNQQLIIVETVFQLHCGERAQIQEKMNHYRLERQEKQPWDYPSAGSVFKNPPGDSAGRLIEAVGAKGWRIGDAVVSEKHGNFILNLGHATSEDVQQLVTKIKIAVQQQFQVNLQEEFLFLS